MTTSANGIAQKRAKIESIYRDELMEYETMLENSFRKYNLKPRLTPKIAKKEASLSVRLLRDVICCLIGLVIAYAFFCAI